MDYSGIWEKKKYSWEYHGGINEILMVGPDISVNLEDRFVLNLQYLVRDDSHVFTTTGVQQDVRTQGGFAEIIFSPKGDMSTWYLTGSTEHD